MPCITSYLPPKPLMADLPHPPGFSRRAPVGMAPRLARGSLEGNRPGACNGAWPPRSRSAWPCQARNAGWWPADVCFFLCMFSFPGFLRFSFVYLGFTNFGWFWFLNRFWKVFVCSLFLPTHPSSTDQPTAPLWPGIYHVLPLKGSVCLVWAAPLVGRNRLGLLW